MQGIKFVSCIEYRVLSIKYDKKIVFHSTVTWSTGQNIGVRCKYEVQGK